MNRNLDGTLLSTADLSAMALDHGLLTADALSTMVAAGHGANMLRSNLLDLTRKTRSHLFHKGLLVLDTRSERNHP